MRVNITKSLHVNEIPKEVRSMIDKIHKYMSYDLQNNLQNIVRLSLSSNSEEFFSSAEHIDAFRKELATIDTAFQGCQNIIRGYKDVVAAPQEVEPPAAEHSEEEYDEEETDQVSDIEEVYEYSNQYEDG